MRVLPLSEAGDGVPVVREARLATDCTRNGAAQPTHWQLGRERRLSEPHQLGVAGGVEAEGVALLHDHLKLTRRMRKQLAASAAHRLVPESSLRGVLECVARALGGKSWDASACPECAAPTVMKDLSVNMTLKSFVENFKSVDAEPVSYTHLTLPTKA